jgi:hypothetical protein
MQESGVGLGRFTIVDIKGSMELIEGWFVPSTK